MNLSISIDGREIGESKPPYIVAEMSANHNGRIENAFDIISAAKKAGADAVKLQTYTADTITLKSNKPEFRIKEGLWRGRTLYDLYEEAHLPWEWHKDLFKFSKEVGITMFSSPFDYSAIDFLETLDAPAYKIASFEAIDLPLIEYAASTGKPLIVSTGMCDDVEIGEAVDAARAAGCRSLILLHCVSGYPAPAVDYHLRTLPDMIQKFGVPVGLSDHTLDNSIAIASVALGACFIEKHFTLDRMGGGPDDVFSLEPDDLGALCEMSRTAFQALGSVNYNRKESEKGNVVFRRSLYTLKDIKKGEVFSMSNVRSVRPGNGLPPKMLKHILGKRASQDIGKHCPLDESHIGV